MKRLLFLLFLLAAPLALRAQGYKTPDVAISNEKANIAGKVYYIHKVLPKQTIFSICKAYGIKDEDLRAANPDIKDGLKAGSVLFIPVDAARIPETAGGKQEKQEKKEVKPAEKPEEPVEALSGTAALPVVERVMEHRVKWYESLAGIARKYNVSEDVIRDYNGLKPYEPIRGKVLLIPIMGEGGDTVGSEGPDLTEPTPRTEVETAAEETPEPMTPVRKVRFFSADEPLHIALVLPFNINGSSASPSFLNFYAGALLAVRDQKENGAQLVLNVYDLSQGADAIIADPGFRKSDLIVGPVEAGTIAPFLAFSDENGIPLVSPLDHKVDSLVDSHPFLYQVPASSDIQVENLVRSLKAASDDLIILVSGTSAADSQLSGRMEALMQADGIAYKKASSQELAGLISGRKTAKVLIGSENKTFTTDVIRNLNMLAKKGLPVQVWCTNRVRSYETSDPDALFNLSAHSSVPYFVDYSNPKDQAFVLRYRALYYAEPDDFAFQGYDVFTCFIAALMQHGTAFLANAEEYPVQLLHCNFHFVKEDEKSGWRNCTTRNLLYEKEGLSISVAK
ncbi:MAG: LysM peptidoglycan-binding domain-containing protein [Bacteroidales bacterium]|nr:LysM peptidoglycan-binding domain-containing protein [Bacteroidales bacterium]